MSKLSEEKAMAAANAAAVRAVRNLGAEADEAAKMRTGREVYARVLVFKEAQENQQSRAHYETAGV